VVIDDSIVRGNTMRNAILPILDRLGPKKIVIASAAPPICYPDCYGIDMASLKELVAFEAAVELLRQRGEMDLLNHCYEEAKRQMNGPVDQMTNCVKPIYAKFTLAELSDAVAARLTPPGLRAKVVVVYQTLDDLADCCKDHKGDWYFSGDYPTPGGNRVVNQALINYVENRDERAY